ncbi:MAG: electron transfer flavoprotein subunit beta/FixA family protein [Bacillota bacterium]
MVMIKQVPDMNKVKFDTNKGVIDRKSAGVEINPFDLNALEAAVQIKEETGGKVIAISMGPPRAKEVIKEAIARGADDGFLVTDKKFAASDTIATSRILSAAIKKIEDFDLITAGVMTVDGDTAQVGSQTAEFLQIPHIAYVTEIQEVTESSLTVISKCWQASYVKKIKYPGLITVTKDLNIPRLPSFKDKMKAKKTEVKILDFSSLSKELKKTDIGLKGSPTRVTNIEIPQKQETEGKIFKQNHLEKALNEIYKICHK